MRILMSALQPGGGIRTFFRYIYSQPCFENCTFVLVAPDNGLSDFTRQHLPEGRITVIPAEPGHVSFIRQVRGLLKTGDFQFVHSHGFAAGMLTELARTGTDYPHLMTAHDVFLKSQFEGWKGRSKHWVMARLFNRMTAIHTVTDDARANLLEFFPGIDNARVKGILHGVDTEYFRNGEPRNLRAELGLDASTPLIGFFGRFMGQKGFRLLVDAMKDIVEQRLIEPEPHVVTFGWGGFIREDYQYLRELGLGNYFHQAEQTDSMPAALKGVDVVAMPSRWEACGLLAMEALAAGVPIVGTRCIGLREVLDKSPAKQVAVGDSHALRQALVEEFGHLAARKQAFREFQPVAVSQFSISRPAGALLELYRELKPESL